MGGKIRDKKKPKKTVNPFELKFNKVHHKVLGKKSAKGSVGHPGLKKKQATEFREKTLGVERERIGKVSKIVDKRIDEKNADKTAEEKASMRFTAERVKNFKKSSKFNLADDDYEQAETLTHGGKALTSIEKYERTMGSDDEEEQGDISGEMVRVAHFGGGDLDQLQSTEEKATRKEIMADLIEKTRSARLKKQEAHDEMETATENLDAKYLKLLNKVQTAFRPIGATKSERPKKDDYDKAVFDMKMGGDARSTPAERTKTEEELASEDQQQLQMLEKLRLARMNAQKNSKSAHLSADADVDPEASSSKKKRKVGFEVRFDSEGKMLDADKVEKHSHKKVAIDSDDELSDEDEDENDEVLDDIDDEESGGEDEEEDGDDVEEGGDRSEDEEDNDDEEDEEDDEDDDAEDEIAEPSVKIPKLKASAVTSDKKKASKDKDDSIPFVFEMPKNFDAAKKLFSSFPAEKLSTVLERLIKCHHPSLKEGNKRLLAKLFLLMLRMYDETSKSTPSKATITVLESLTKALYATMKYDVEYAVRCVRALVRQHWKDRCEGKQRRSPSTFATVALLRIVSALFPVSDAWHVVCSPTFAFASRTLADVQVTNLTVLARQILLVANFSVFVEESRRYVPEMVSFLLGSLLLAVDNTDSDHFPSLSFPVSEPHRRMLLVKNDDNLQSVELEPLSLSEIYEEGNHDSLKNTAINRLRVLRSVIGAIQKLRVVYSTHEVAFSAIFRPFIGYLKRLPLSAYPKILSEECEALRTSMEAECNRLGRVTQLCHVRTEKRMIKMLEPCFEDNFDPERPRLNRDANRKGPNAEKKKMQHIYKKEMRGAVKELRKDNAFLSRKERQIKMSKDKDRRTKTKRLMADLQVQQGQWNQEKFESNGPKKRKK